MRNSDEKKMEDHLADLRAADIKKRHAAEDALVSVGMGAVTPLITFIEGETETEPKWYAARALARIGPPAVLPLLSAIRSNPREEVRRYLAAAVAEMKEPPIGEVVALLGESDPEIRRHGTMILCRIGGPAMEALKTAAQEDEGILGRCAQYTLLRIGVEPRETSLRKE
ncbi:MAG: HEAT repeat domain-containing protein [Methanomicrobiales archaeon]|nr:HEAT repeat domain-containing protein [Methanomicrobiales archaeon]